MKTNFTVPGKPKGKGRPRFTKHGGVYTPKNTVDYEKLILATFLANRQSFCSVSEKPIFVNIFACFNSKKNPWELKPDADNIAKVVLDALNNIVYLDDKQVVSLNVEKFSSDDDYLYIEVEELFGG